MKRDRQPPEGFEHDGCLSFPGGAFSAEEAYVLIDAVATGALLDGEGGCAVGGRQLPPPPRASSAARLPAAQAGAPARCVSSTA